MIKGISGVLLFSLLFLGINNSFAQSKKIWIYQADNYYEKQNFASALRLYHMVLDDTLGLSTRVLPYEVDMSNQKFKNDSSAVDTTKNVSIGGYVRHQIAMCYRYSHDYTKAAQYFKESAEAGEYPDDYYYYGNTLMYMGKYDSALATFEHFMTLDGTTDNALERAFQDMSGCVFAKNLEESDEDIEVKLSDTIIFNKGTSSYAPMFWGGPDKLIFTSARAGGIVLDPLEQDSRYLSDLYWTEKDEEGNWMSAKNFGRPLNSARHEASGAFNDGNIIYYTRWSDVDRKEKHIYLARMISMKFFESFQLDSAVNLPGYQSINPFITSDNKWMYFSSDRPGGYGGLDIYKIELDEFGNPMGDAINLGKPVNSEFDEKTPFYHEVSNTLFFSSDGHESIGGLDIFKSTYDKDVSSFRKPENMGEPINSTHDDSYYVIDDNLRYGFLTSNRSDCSECDSLYSLCSHCYKIYDVVQPELEFKISGYVYDLATNEVIPGATVAFKDVSYQWEHFEITADENGYYEHDLIPNLQLFMRASMIDYFADKAIVFTQGETESRSYRQDFYLEQIPEGEITIEGIEYDFDKATLRPESIVILNKLLDFLELNNNLKIEIRSHTDERGSAEYNERLSQERAQSVVDYLIENGIPMDRLVAKGYGENMPAEVPDTSGNIVALTPEYIYSLDDKELQKEYHQRNRRTAFFVLEQK
ncbi:MAG: OmpA family protein [Crocinitomicaceae bacterium]|nr:OmpA family protein [Crocinitomicaceae bacterium]